MEPQRKPHHGVCRRFAFVPASRGPPRCSSGSALNGGPSGGHAGVIWTRVFGLQPSVEFGKVIAQVAFDTSKQSLSAELISMAQGLDA